MSHPDQKMSSTGSKAYQTRTLGPFLSLSLLPLQRNMDVKKNGVPQPEVFSKYWCACVCVRTVVKVDS